MKTVSPLTVLVSVLLSSVVTLFPHEEIEPPDWTYYLRSGSAYLDSPGAMAFARVKRVHGNTFYDIQLSGFLLPEETFAIGRYKSSYKFSSFPRWYKFSIVSLRHSSVTDLAIRYHYNQGLGLFIFNNPSGHLTGELAFSYDISDYLHDTRKTSYLKGGLFWDVDLGANSSSIDFEYFYQISDIIPGEPEQTRYEISANVQRPILKTVQIIIGYEKEFYRSHELDSITTIYFAVGLKRPLPITF